MMSSVIADILDRLTGIAIVRERLFETGQKIDRLADVILDHEKRILSLKAVVFPRILPQKTRRLATKK